jgi:hypothetical protein
MQKWSGTDWKVCLTKPTIRATLRLVHFDVNWSNNNSKNFASHFFVRTRFQWPDFLKIARFQTLSLYLKMSFLSRDGLCFRDNRRMDRVLAKIESIIQLFIRQEFGSRRFGNQSVSIGLNCICGMRSDCQQIQGLFLRTALHKNCTSLLNLKPWFERGINFTTVCSLNQDRKTQELSKVARLADHWFTDFQLGWCYSPLRCHFAVNIMTMCVTVQRRHHQNPSNWTQISNFRT